MRKYFSIGFGLVILFMSACGDRRDSASANYDSLFLGLKFGMAKRDFFAHCWDLNKQKIVTHGPNQVVEYRLVNEVDHPVMMRFYPSFEEERIYEMPVTFTYEAWAPWNRQFQADSLLDKMLNVFERWYGDDFKVMEHHTMGKVYYKMDGYRRINLFKRDDQFVQAVFTDMRVEEQLKKENRSPDRSNN